MSTFHFHNCTRFQCKKRILQVVKWVSKFNLEISRFSRFFKIQSRLSRQRIVEKISSPRHSVLDNLRDMRGSGWLYPKNSMLKKLFDKFLIKINENGIHYQISQKYFLDESQDVCRVEPKPIEYRIVTSVFTLLIIGCFVEICLLVMETFMKFKSTRHIRQ